MLQLTLNAGKRTINLDLNDPEDKDRLRKLLADVDIFVQGYRYGILARKGLGLKDMLKIASQRNKGIVYVEENCYRPDGPFATRPGWQQMADAASDVSYVIGKSLGGNEGYSVLPSIPVADMTTGLVAATAAMMAIRDRAVKGGSYHVFSSLVSVNTIALQPQVGLYPPETVRNTAQAFHFMAGTPDQYIAELAYQTVEAWQERFPGIFDDDSSIMVQFRDSFWPHQSVLKPVIKLNEEGTTPEWRTPPVPNCYHSPNTTWL